MMDLIIRDGFLVMPGEGIVKGSLAVDGEKIAGIFRDDLELEAKEEIDARGLYVFPGVVQPHAHLGRQEGMEDFATETYSAALGGVTTNLIFHRDPGSYGKELQETIDKAARLSYTDFSYHIQVMSHEQVKNIPRYLREGGISSFKFNMGYKGAEAVEKGIEELNDGLMVEGFRQIAGLAGAIACVHAENSEIIAHATAKMRDLGRDDLKAWCESRPACAESEAINRALYFSESTGCPLYVAHMTTAEGLQLIKEHRRQGRSKVFVETCPQYLTHHMDSPVGRRGKFIPPLRKEADNEALWQGLIAGDIDAIGIDQIARKVAPEQVSVWERTTSPREAVTALPVLITEGYFKRGLALERIAELTASGPATIFNLSHRKGFLRAGNDADVAIVDIHRKKQVTGESMKSASEFSIYEGWTLTGWPVMTLSRGKIVMRDGEITGERGWGNFIPRN